MTPKPEPVSEPKAYPLKNDPSVGGGMAPKEDEPLPQVSRWPGHGLVCVAQQSGIPSCVCRLISERQFYVPWSRFR